MAEDAAAGRLDQLAAAADGSARLPREKWDPPFCGDIPMRIAGDGTWHYAGSPILRPALVRLFASVLRREGERFYLVTPVEKVGIVVDDAPFLAVELDWSSATLRAKTNLDEWVAVDASHPLRFERGSADGLKPYVHVRDGLWALLTRAVSTELIGRGETRALESIDMFGIASGQTFFAIAPAAGWDDDEP